MDPDDLLCPMIASWLALPFACCFLLALYYIVEINIILLYVLITVLSLGLLTIAISITLSYKTNNLLLYKISKYISFAFIFLLLIFVLYFFISSIINLFKAFSDNSFWSALFKFFGVMVPLSLLISMLLNVAHVKKDDSNSENEIKIESD